LKKKKKKDVAILQSIKDQKQKEWIKIKIFGNVKKLKENTKILILMLLLKRQLTQSCEWGIPDLWALPIIK
jgi:hypothetical protein